MIECRLTTVNSLRRICKCVCFGILFIWIVVGSYNRYYTGDREETSLYVKQESNSDEIGGTRRLLGIDIIQTEYNNRTYTIDKNAECSDLHHFPKHQELLCEFVTQVPACGGDGGLIPYFKIVYCWIPLNLIPLSMIILFFWLLFLFVFLGTTAEEYFCPALTVISRLLHLSQNIAGVTLLAFGNGAPDIFSALAAINQPDIKRASLAFGALYGAGMFVCCVVVGAVIVSKPFMLTRRPYMRDLIFYLAACYWTFFLLWNNSINVWMSTGFILLYLTYVSVVIFGRLIYQKWKKKGTARTGDIPRPPEKEKGEEMAGTISVTTTGNNHGNSAVPKQRVMIRENGHTPYDSLTHSGEVMDPSHATVVDLEVGKKIDRNQDQHGLPVTVEIHVEHDNDSRCSTPKQRSASRASQVVYGVSSEDEDSVHAKPTNKTGALTVGGTITTRNGHLTTSTQMPRLHHPDDSPNRPASSNSQRRLRKTISGALDITENVGLTAMGTPNLSKLWHHAYRKELTHKGSSQGDSSYHRRSLERSKSPAGFGHSDNRSDDEHSSGKENEEDMLLGASAASSGKFQRKKVPHPFVRMLLVFWPFGDEFKDLPIWGKAYELVKYPANFFLSLTVPVIDQDEDIDNWNRWLNIAQCVLAPLFICFTLQFGLILIGGIFPVYILVLVAGIILAICVACTSENHVQPKYHCIFAWLGFGVAVVWIYTVANEIVSVLQVFGIVIKISDGILGITLLAWGNSVGDAVANITMARQGFPRMAIGACYGGPLLNMLLGIGLAATVKFVQQKSLGFSLYFTQVQMLAALFLLFSLTMSLIISSCLKFKMHRYYGFGLFVLYLVFLVVVILAEVKVFDIKIHNVLQ